MVVPGTGVEPVSLEAADFKSAAFTSFATRAAARIVPRRRREHAAMAAISPGCDNWRDSSSPHPNAMIVLDLSCANEHRFEGWFASSAAFEAQLARGLVSCPVCNGTEVRRLPSAPYVQTRSTPAAEAPSGRPSVASPQTAAAIAASPSPAPGTATPAAVAELLGALRRMAKAAEDVGERLPEEARRIHHGEAEARDIRGAASRDEIEELLEEGIMVLPVPPLDDELH